MTKEESTESDREAAENHWKSKCNGSYFIAKACSDTTTKDIATDFYIEGILHERSKKVEAASVERDTGFLHRLFDHAVQWCVSPIRGKGTRAQAIDEFLAAEQERAKK